MEGLDTSDEEHHWPARLAGRTLSFFQTALATALLAFFLVLCFANSAAWADEASSRTVRVAFPQQENMTWTDETGHRSGYVYEYLEHIAQHTGWHYEFVPVNAEGFEAYQASAALLEAGKVDLICGALFSEANAARFALSSSAYLNMGTVLLALDDDADTFRIQDADVVRVATLEAPELVNDARFFCSSIGVEMELVACADREEQLAALHSGNADVALSASVIDRSGLIVVAEAASHSLRFACSKDDVQLANELDAAMSSIKGTEETLESDLVLKYFGTSNQSVALSDADRAFVATRGPVRVGMLRDDPPYQSEQDGSFRGIAVSFLDKISERTGLTFEYVGADTEQEIDRMLAAGEVDMAASVDCGYEAARERGLKLTQPYVSTTYVLVANDGVQEADIAGMRLAILSSSRYGGPYVGEAIPFEGRRACLQAVVDGQADYTYVDEYVVQYFLNSPGFRELRIAPQVHEERKVRFAIAEGTDLALLEILDKSLGSLDEMERQAAVNENVLIDGNFDWVDYMRANPVQTAVTATSVVLVIVALVLVILYQRARANAKTAFDLKKKLRLYSLSEDYFFEFDRQRNFLVVSVPSNDGETLADPVSLSFEDLVSAEDDGPRQQFLAIMRADERVVEEVQLPDADGILHWLRITVEPVFEGSSHAAYSVGTIAIVDEERHERDRLVAKAERDGLTRVLNAATMRSRVQERLMQLGDDDVAAVLVVDVDEFKDVNDQHGHLLGDQVLAGVAALLRERVRVGDAVGRIGGDEFMVYLHQMQDADELSRLCETLCREISRREYGNEGFSVTVSIGGAMIRGSQRFEDAYERADEALYEAKRAGRNRCCVVAD